MAVCIGVMNGVKKKQNERRTSSIAVNRIQVANDKIIHQNFQSLGTSWSATTARSLAGFSEDWELGTSMSLASFGKLVILKETQEINGQDDSCLYVTRTSLQLMQFDRPDHEFRSPGDEIYERQC